MSLGPAFDAKEQVRQAVDIVDLVGSYIQLRRQGRNFVGLCPWHDDSRPSLNVNPDRQSWKCWVCDVGGDVFSFVMKAEGLEFRETLELLAEKAGITLRQPGQGSPDDSQPSGGPSNDKRVLLRVMAWAEEQFHRCLVDAPEGEPGRKYLAERGISSESIRRFHLGYAPQTLGLAPRSHPRARSGRPASSNALGLLRRKEVGGEHYDWFRGRVMFSIRDARSRPIAFGGRVLPQLAGERDAKYINSPETPLFSKSRELYGLDMAREAIAHDQRRDRHGRLHRLHHGPPKRPDERRRRARHRARRRASATCSAGSLIASRSCSTAMTLVAAAPMRSSTRCWHSS